MRAALAFLCLSAIANAEIITLGEHRGDLGILADFSINGANNVWEVGQADIDASRSYGGFQLDTDAATLSYIGNSPYFVGREAVRNFSVANGLNGNKNYQLRMTINESFYLYTQTTDATAPVTEVGSNFARTPGISQSNFEPILFGLSGSYSIQGPTESVSGTFQLDDLTYTGSLVGNWGGFPYGSYMRLARDGNGNIVDKVGINETYVYSDMVFDFSDQTLFDQMVDGEQLSMTLTSANYQQNTLIGEFNAVPEPSSAGLLSIAGLAAFFRRKR